MEPETRRTPADELSADDSTDGGSAELRRELDYYRRQLDELAGENLRQTFIGSGLGRRLAQKQQGFAALTALQEEFSLEAPLEQVVGSVLRAILRTLGMDRAAALVRSSEGCSWRVLGTLGLSTAMAGDVATLELVLPEDALPDERGLLATSQTPPGAFHSIVSTALSLPWFAALPIALADGVTLLLVAGRLVESRPFRPRLDQGDLDTLVAIGRLITTWTQNRHVVALREELVQRERERHAMMERERTRISRDMHDEIGAALTRIAIVTELARSGIADRDEVAAHLDTIAAGAREVVDTIGEIVWALDPSNDTLDNLAAFVREMASTFIEGTSLELVVDYPDIIEPVRVSAELRRNVSLVVKEAVNNAVKYAQAHTIRLVMLVAPELLTMIVSDDGNGFAAERSGRRGNGLVNMCRRMTDVDGECRIESTPGRGTVVTIVAPLPRHPAVPVPKLDSHFHGMARS